MTIGTFGTFGTFGTITTFVKDKNKRKRKSKDRPKNNVNTAGDRFKCSRCTVKSDNEDVLISHVMAENECKATFYKDSGKKCCSDAPGTLACIDCPMGKN